jgi:hypothetical protein
VYILCCELARGVNGNQLIASVHGTSSETLFDEARQRVTVQYLTDAQVHALSADLPSLVQNGKRVLVSVTIRGVSAQGTTYHAVCAGYHHMTSAWFYYDANEQSKGVQTIAALSNLGALGDGLLIQER